VSENSDNPHPGLAAVVLAAGQGTRMKSRWPKVLHQAAGRPMLEHVLQAVAALRPRRTVVVLGAGADQVRSALPPGVDSVLQESQLGTGHALAQAAAAVGSSAGEVLVLYGDMPLLRPETLRSLVEARGGAVASLLTAQIAGLSGYGRILRSPNGSIQTIVEEVEASPEQRAITETNSGVYCFESPWIWDALSRLNLHPNGEYYLTDVVGLAVEEGRAVVGVPAADPDEVQGVNNRAQLAQAEATLRQRIRQRLMLAGVTLVDPPTAYIDGTVVVGADTVVYPNTILEGRTTIGEGCVIGPNSHIRDSSVGAGCRVIASVVEEATLEDEVRVGPFSHLRPGAYLCRGVFLGNYAEVKNSRLGPGTEMHHFSYVGDATVGANVNVAAGVITCNFDAETQEKNATTIEDDVALGSDTMLVAPVRVGAGAITGAGSVVTKDVAPDTVVRGVPARPARATKTRGSPVAKGRS
jgi:bifunctional UDP-N-acetylglucosamine pyrophosphorylase/glucosamine-1-phosphate N-acetyltransferase